MEEWESITDYEGLYEVSSLGRVKRLGGSCRTKGGGTRSVQSRMLKLFPSKSRGNYIVVTLNNKGTKQVKVHRLVAIAFLPNPDDL